MKYLALENRHEKFKLKWHARFPQHFVTMAKRYGSDIPLCFYNRFMISKIMIRCNSPLSV